MTGLAQLERQALSSTLTRLGPDAPTLCEGWRSRDLAAHIVLRERRPDAVAGAFVPPLAAHTQRVQDGYAEGAWEGLVEMVREGPPGWSPSRLPGVDDAVNLLEFYVHHEDLLRAAPDWTPEQRRALDHSEQEALWSRLGQMGQLLFRRSPVGIVLVTPEHGRRAVKGPTKLGTVVLRGEPSELILYGFGRAAVAQVDVEGEAEAVEALRNATFGV
ncbi:uncharacterized protein (TIGR03085 family) [Kineosphaera limosa]|uniref:Mycothiol-dependent maleylpyruvate isomerase metal-binding domain-containing protein n=1 Tax=Kineosphaera limosa NBRC 100340 TaxID=1184609 RepID=K6W5E1_9MICO|nr:TIGR03085 family metal-binding protein [Kineosphaera limosa]NYE03048.1 uncharacterized protein (TIGR03085 family) [Kineosphaera limosa]GAB94385.1 hypothetical protein KILIM_005_00030 [Kineosphaera limosa NBRC 100340]